MPESQAMAGAHVRMMAAARRMRAATERARAATPNPCATRYASFNGGCKRREFKGRTSFLTRCLSVALVRRCYALLRIWGSHRREAGWGLWAPDYLPS